jgi:hypothetical protein
MRVNRTAIAVLSLLALTACASEPVQPLMVPRSGPESFGYTDWQVVEDRYVVTFSGPEVLTTNTQDQLVKEAETRARDTAFDLAVWRAADLALINGYPYFTLTKVDGDVRQAIVGHDYRDNGNPVYDNVQGEALGYATAIYFRPEVTISVELHKDKAKGTNDAEAIANAMSKRYADAADHPIAAHTYYYFGPSVVLDRGGGGVVKVEPPRSGPSMKYAPYAGNKY